MPTFIVQMGHKVHQHSMSFITTFHKIIFRGLRRDAMTKCTVVYLILAKFLGSKEAWLRAKKKKKKNSGKYAHLHSMSFIITMFHKFVLNGFFRVAMTNKRPMDHIAHLRKQFKSINTYDYISWRWLRENKNIFNWIYWFFIWRNLNPLHPRCIVPSLVEIGPAVLEKIFKFRQCIIAV